MVQGLKEGDSFSLLIEKSCESEGVTGQVVNEPPWRLTQIIGTALHLFTFFNNLSQEIHV
jgi:hypothetical protein